ncbi:MAG TPA: adenylate/guanylate cyclase domain-containing protein [Mycobacterium sp.]
MGAVTCVSCGIALREGAKFCDECGSPTTGSPGRAEYKQVTVLFADVVHSMDIAAAVGSERLREIMAELVNRAAAVVERYGGTLDKFTGDGIMALFGAPKALEDHAARACRAALDIQVEAGRLGDELIALDHIHLRLRIGLNSGEVIAGEVGGARMGYTAIGEQVGMAQRMESVAPSGGVMVSESTARLVTDDSVLSEPKSLAVKGFDHDVVGYELLGMAPSSRQGPRRTAKLVGREWELSALTAMLDQAADGQGRVVGLVGAPGIGKSRLSAELASEAEARGFDVHWAVCESHASDVPFHVVADLLRASSDVRGLDDEAARALVRERNPEADPEDRLLFDDLLGIADPAVPLPDIDPDARRRRVTALVWQALLARETPAIFIIEDVHWIDQVSESMLADFAAVIPQSRALAVFTYRPEYDGLLVRVPGGQTISLTPLSIPSSTALTTELVGTDPSVAEVVSAITARAGGNPLFTEEIVRDLAEQGVLTGERGSYRCPNTIRDISVPPTLQATIAARIDRLDPAAKRCLGAAAVVGIRFDPGLLERLGVEPAVEELIGAELIEPVLFAREARYAFRHPMIRTVAYESQLRSDRTDVHRRLADVLGAGDQNAADENAALIAEHLELAGDLLAAYDWHMRAATWSATRDIRAAQTNWRRARDVADRIPGEEPETLARRIVARASLCATAWRSDATITDTGFEELRELCEISGDTVSLAIGMAGAVTAVLFDRRYSDAARMGTEHIRLLEAIGDPTILIGLSMAAGNAKWQAGEVTAALRLMDRAIDLADGDPTVGNLVMGSPLAASHALRAGCIMSLGLPGLAEEFDLAATLAREIDTTSYLAVLLWRSFAYHNAALGSDAHDLDEAREALHIAERSGDDFALNTARSVLAVSLSYGDSGQSAESVESELLRMREDIQNQRYANQVWIPRFDQLVAIARARRGDDDGAIDLIRSVLDGDLAAGVTITAGPSTTLLVESLLRRGAPGDLEEAESAIARLAAQPVDPGFVLYELPLLRLRALVAEARGDHADYLDYRDQYRAMARRVDFKPHIAMAEAMD